jgi:RNA polymerase sigma factor (TIGR02999 family)
MEQSARAAFEAAYPDVLRLARTRLASERAPISTLTLAHELFIEMQGRSELRFASHGHFMAYAARAMRHLLVDMARERLAGKRDAELLPLTLGEEVIDTAQATPERLLALNQALEQLGQLDERLLRVAELRAVMGLEVGETAAALGISEPTVKRDWQRARAFLFDALGRTP